MSATLTIRRPWRRPSDTPASADAGQLSLGVAITIPAVFLFLALVIMAGRLAAANGAVQAAAA
ncbi:MAG: hypothetical protein FWD11_00150, partial [Micrococcales bacterium]|nr:hypothetical protein [Micrococcales bacterium]